MIRDCVGQWGIDGGETIGSLEPTDPIELRHAATDRATIVVVPERRLLAIDGVGPPTSDDYRFATAVLRRVGEALRRRELSVDARVGVIESVWWIHQEATGEEMATRFADRSDWHWQQMIEVPHAATDADAQASIDDAREQAGRSAPLVRLVRLTEGRAAQILHVDGPVTESAAVGRLYAAVTQAGLRPRGHLHQIQLADAEHVPAGRGRSIIRLPIEPM